ncbi:flagellar hook-associated protein FlgL [Aliagarivorans taiwanensis]|uniref:flagellar hook-associated protein FlgL n=1 Tax=Aliagarivorans taiwanensis TaxID=561966 RepID=UPI000422ABB5|nr:flagellar hook-associated protein FlgL [Aliagarivorans taiwanensis]
MMRVSTPNIYFSSLAGVLDGQERVQKTNQHLVTNKRLLTAADGPSDMTKTMFLSTEITLTEQHLKNGTVLESALNFEESVLEGMITASQRARVLGIQSGDGIIGDTERASLAQELRQIQDQLLDFMNSKAADGSYIFAGFQTHKQPYVYDGNEYNYQGDNGKNDIKVSSSVFIQSYDTGQEVFDNVQKRLISNDLTAGVNTTVSDQAAYDSFHNNNYDPFVAANNAFTVTTTAGTPDTYTIQDSGGTVLDTGNFVVGQPISFAGLAIDVTAGVPAAEQFELAVPEKRNILNTLGDFIAALEDPSVLGEDYTEAQNDFIVGLDNALEKLNLTQGSVGARGNSLDSVRDAARAMDVINQQSRAALSEVDFAAAVTELQQAELALNTSYASYSRISQLTLFNYI